METAGRRHVSYDQHCCAWNALLIPVVATVTVTAILTVSAVLSMSVIVSLPVTVASIVVTVNVTVNVAVTVAVQGYADRHLICCRVLGPKLH